MKNKNTKKTGPHTSTSLKEKILAGCQNSQGTSRDFLRFRQRADPLVIIELLRGRVFFFFEKHQLRVEQEAALFRQVCCGPLNRENVKALEQAPRLASSCEGDSLATVLTWSSAAIPVLLRPCALLPRRFTPPRRTPHWWDGFRCPSSAG